MSPMAMGRGFGPLLFISLFLVSLMLSKYLQRNERIISALAIFEDWRGAGVGQKAQKM